jgi:hypothetical protein
VDEMTLKELVKNKTVRFQYYRDGELTYKTEDGFEFQVPISDAGMGTFLAEDKAIFFMRWIRKQLELLKGWENKANREITSGVLRYVVPVNLTQQYMGIDEDKVLRFTEKDLENQP